MCVCPTDHGQHVLGGGQHVLQDEQQHGDGEQHGDLETELLTPGCVDEEGGQVQHQQVEERHNQVDDVQQRLPDDGHLTPHSDSSHTH